MSDIILHPKNRFTWNLLAFQGGFINMGGLLSIHFFVSHVTGFAAHLSLQLFEQDYLKSFYFILVPVFFLMGAFLSSIFTEIRRKNNAPPIYIHILLFLSGIFLAVALLGANHFFGVFGNPFESIRDFILLSILSFACGMQNAIFTHYSKSIIRTTHLTGITTDLGIGLARYFISKDLEEGKINRIRIELILFFCLGSTAGVYIFKQFQFYGFLLPSLISLLVGIRLFQSRRITRP